MAVSCSMSDSLHDVRIKLIRVYAIYRTITRFHNYRIAYWRHGVYLSKFVQSVWYKINV